MPTTRLNRTLAPALIAAGAAVASAQPEYDAVIIEPWDQSYDLAISRVSGLNNLNVASGCAHPLEGNCSFLWTLDGDKEQVNLGGAINDLGYVAGTSWLRTPAGELMEMPGLGNAQDLNESIVVVGYASGRYWGGCRWTRHATAWDPTNGTRALDTDLGVPAAHEARAVNEWNETVGVRSTTGSCGDFEAFYLNLDTGEHIDIHAELVGGGMGITEAFDINGAGVVVGEGPWEGEGRAFLWSRDGGFEFLPNLPGTIPSYSSPSSLNDAGTVVGQAIVDNDWRAWVWDADRGIRDLNDLAAGLPEDFAIVEAKKINDNGWIIGRGHYGAWSPERAVVLIPRDTGCPADFNDDGVVNTLDVLAFLNAWTASDPEADFNGDGAVNTLDVLAFLNAWNAGC